MPNNPSITPETTCQRGPQRQPDRLRILFATPECYPLIKRGGLGDAADGITKQINYLGHDARLILPAYPEARERALGLRTLLELPVRPTHRIPVGGARLLVGSIPGRSTPVYLVDIPSLYDFPGAPYDQNHQIDQGVQEDGRHGATQQQTLDARRFGVFCEVVAQLAQQGITGWRPDLVHCNDWPTALVPALLSDAPESPASVFSIHNLAYQGVFPEQAFSELGLPQHFWSPDGLEFYGQLSFIKGGLGYADQITTVSPSYARQILTPEYGEGLEGVLAQRATHLTGILNGVDYDVWNCARDPLIESRYDLTSLSGKLPNKIELQQGFGLPCDPDVPVLGFVGRLVEQKGVDLLLEILPDLLARSVQLVVLGSGNSELEQRLAAAARTYRNGLGVYLGYDERRAHQIIAGADLLVMPSHFEPCGLTQLYALRYGTLPLVHLTGGLADTVQPLPSQVGTPASQNSGPPSETVASAPAARSATGFGYIDNTRKGLLRCLDQALGIYQTPSWRTLQIRGMKLRFSWKSSAKSYLKVYHNALEQHRRINP